MLRPAHGESVGPYPDAQRAHALDARHAVDLIIDTVMAHDPGEITLVPTGGLTNIALAARKEPRIVERVREVVLMGGGYHTGNRTPVAEVNIRIDPIRSSRSCRTGASSGSVHAATQSCAAASAWGEENLRHA